MTHDPSIITVGGSHGTLRVHRATGIIVERVEACDCGECANGYEDIARFDPVVFAHDPEVTYWDILSCGYWSHEGVYEPAMTVRDRSGPCRIGGRVMWFYEDFDDWVPLALLPAPAKVPGGLVIVHAWQWEDGHQTYATPGLDPVDGWCIYRRIPTPDGPCDFDVEDEQDFDDCDAAVAAAETLAAIYGATVCVED